MRFVSIVKNGRRYDLPLDQIAKGEPIKSDSPVISRGAIVSLKGHKGKVLDTTGELASVSWEDASISQVPMKELKYEGRVEKSDRYDEGGEGSGRYPAGSGKKGSKEGKDFETTFHISPKKQSIGYTYKNPKTGAEGSTWGFNSKREAFQSARNIMGRGFKVKIKDKSKSAM